MKKIFVILLLFFLGTIGTTGTTQAYSNVNFSFSFHDALDPYGSWVSVSSYGNVFRPRVAAGWRPYTQGHWIYTDYGPMWDTAEPYGWATYHYGRWIFTASYGWVWVPGYEYYPSRVTWAYGDDYLGWSPIYPNPGYSNVNVWVFIDRDHYGYGDYSRHYLRGDRIRPLFDRRVMRIRESRWDRADFERVVRRPVQVVKVRERSFEADRHRVRMLVPEHRESQVVREVSRAAKIRQANADRFENSRSKVAVKHTSEKSHKFSANQKADFKQASKSKVVVKSTPKSHASKKVETTKASKSKAVVKSTAPKKSHVSQSKFSNNNKKVEVKHSAKSKAFVKSTAPKKSYVSTTKFTSKKVDVKPKTKFTSNKRMESRQPSKQQTVKPVSKKEVHKKAVKKPSSKSNRKRNPS